MIYTVSSAGAVFINTRQWQLRTQTKLDDVGIIRPNDQRGDKDYWNGSQKRQAKPNHSGRHFSLLHEPTA